jgi:HEAT repeat protein
MNYPVYETLDRAIAELRQAPEKHLSNPRTHELFTAVATAARLYPGPDCELIKLLEQEFDRLSAGGDLLVTMALYGALMGRDSKQAARIAERMLTDNRMLPLHEDIAEDLGRIGDAGSAEALIGALSSPESHVRLKAAKSLGALSSSQSVPALGKAIGDPVESVRVAAMRALEKLAPRDARTAALQVLKNDPDTYVRTEAAEILADLRAHEAEPLIRKLAETEQDEDTRTDLIDALKRLEARQKEGADAQ